VVVSARAAPAALPPSGGAVTVTAVVEHASACRLEALSSQPFLATYPRGLAHCEGGRFSAVVRVGANSTAVQQRVTLAVVASNDDGWYTEPLNLVLAAGVASSPPGLAVPVRRTAGYKWSGYVALGGPFTRANGTFTVPYVRTDGCSQQLSEWVGVDGEGNSALIQAGVSEGDVDPSTGDCTAGQPKVWAWWEVLPTAAKPLTTLTVSSGDQVTVALWRLSPAQWGIELTDDSTGESYGLAPYYGGPASSAEWVVEAPTDSSACMDGGPLTPGVCQVAPYSPPVSFTDIHIGGSASRLTADSLEEGRTAVSVPSPLTTDGFMVTYRGPNP
jgi:hypothetical protein